MDFFVIAIAILILSTLVILPSWFARVIFAPFVELLKESKSHKFSFQLVDFFCLVFLLSLQFGLVQCVASFNSTGSRARQIWAPWESPSEQTKIICALGLAILFGYCWLRGVGVLSRIGVLSVWKRAAFLCFIIPIGMFGAASILVAFWLLIGGRLQETWHIIGVLAWYASLPFVASRTRLFSKWICVRDNDIQFVDEAVSTDPLA